MLKATAKIYNKYDTVARFHAVETAKMTVGQIRRDYLREAFTAACRHRLDIWDFAQKFMSSDVAFLLDKPSTLLALERDEIFRKFFVEATRAGTELKTVPNKKSGMEAFRDISPEAEWLVDLYSKWYAKTGEACCEIAERAPASLLKKIHKKAMNYGTEEILDLLIEHSAEQAMITSKDFDELEKP